MSRLQLVLRGIRRHQGNALSRTPRQPITLSHLRTLHHYIHHHYSGRNALMLWSSDTDAFFGLLRASEFTSPTTSEYAPSTLMFHHVTVTYDPSAVRLYLPKSKTDQYSTGSTIHLFPQPQPFCPVTATTAYMHSHPTILAFSHSTMVLSLHADLLLLFYVPFSPTNSISTHIHSV